LSAVGDYRLGGVIPLRSLFGASQAVGKTVAKIRGAE
jgi:hypothetical protein